jgi:hypothetical protein
VARRKDTTRLGFACGGLNSLTNSCMSWKAFFCAVHRACQCGLSPSNPSGRSPRAALVKSALPVKVASENLVTTYSGEVPPE